MAASSSAATGGAGATASATSVIEVPKEVVETFTALKTRRKHGFLHVSLGSDFKASISKIGAVGSTGKAFIQSLPTSDCRYAIFDHEETLKDGRKKSKLYFITWTPAAAPGRSKMFYTSQRTSKALQDAFTGVEDVQCSKVEEVAKLLGVADLIEEDEGDWDPDA